MMIPKLPGSNYLYKRNVRTLIAAIDDRIKSLAEDRQVRDLDPIICVRSSITCGHGIHCKDKFGNYFSTICPYGINVSNCVMQKLNGEFVSTEIAHILNKTQDVYNCSVPSIWFVVHLLQERKRIGGNYDKQMLEQSKNALVMKLMILKCEFEVQFSKYLENDDA